MNGWIYQTFQKQQPKHLIQVFKAHWRVLLQSVNIQNRHFLYWRFLSVKLSHENEARHVVHLKQNLVESQKLACLTSTRWVLPARSLLVMPLPLVLAVQEALQLGRRGVWLGLGRQRRCLAGLALARRPGRPGWTGLRHPVHLLASFNIILKQKRDESEDGRGAMMMMMMITWSHF